MKNYLLNLQFYTKLRQGGKKIMAFCLTARQRFPLIVLCWKSQLWMDFKIKFNTSRPNLIPAGQKKEHETLYITLTIWKNWSSYRWLLITQNLKKDKVIITIKHENYSIQWEFESSNMNFFRFCLEGTSERVRFLEFHQQGFVCISSFWVFKLSRVNCVYKFASFLIKLQ